MPYFDSNGTRAFRSRAPMPCEMYQRPSLVCMMLGEWFGISSACRQVSRHSGTRRITQCMMSSSGFFDTASCTATETSWPWPVR